MKLVIATIAIVLIALSVANEPVGHCAGMCKHVVVITK